MTETSPVTHFQTESTSEIGSCGFPIPNTFSKIIDVETGKALGPNEVSMPFNTRLPLKNIFFWFCFLLFRHQGPGQWLDDQTKGT